jgi:hypothetical protein
LFPFLWTICQQHTFTLHMSGNQDKHPSYKFRISVTLHMIAI